MGSACLCRTDDEKGSAIDRGIEYAKYRLNIRKFAVNPEGKCLEDWFREKSTGCR